MVPAEEIADLAELYDRFAHALDPFSEDRDKAEDAFYLKLEHLRCVYAPRINSRQFTREAVRQCKLFLKKN
jgi:hypothetical protein